MANPEHVSKLKEGVESWNRWRLDPSATLPEGYVNEADLSEAKLSGAELSGANLIGAELSGAELSGAKLSGTNLSNARLEESNFDTAEIGVTTFGNVDLSTVRGLETIHHRAPSTVGVDTIYLSKGNIPEAFLRGAGVPDDFIVFMRSLAANPIEFYSCFISYSSKDQEFADLLHSQLQAKRVRVWLATEDLKIGDKFRARIDESIRLYDKLMVVLSENSIRSAWVEEEVEAALEKERRQGKLVLFPIRLDDAVMDTNQAWAASLRRIRHIGNFTKWKDHDSWQDAFKRLLRDLKAGKAQD